MNRKGTFTAILLGIILLVALVIVGCSKETEPSATEEKVVVIGVDAPLTGPNAKLGQEDRDTVNMAFEEIGYKIGDYTAKLVFIDDESDPEKATRAYEQAIQKDKIQVGFLNRNSSTAVALMEVVAKYKIPHFFGFGATELVDEKWNSDDKYKYWAVKGWPAPSRLLVAYSATLDEAMAAGIYKPRNRKVAIIGEDNDWGRAFGASVGQNLKDSGWEIVSENYFKAGETDMYPILTKIKSEDVSVVAGTIISAPSMAAFVKQARDTNLKALMLMDSLGENAEFYKLTGEASDYVLDARPLFTSEAGKKFVADFEAKYGYTPSSSNGGQAYDYTKFFIKIANETLKEYGDLSSESFMKFAQEKLWTGQISYTDTAMGVKEIKYAPGDPNPIVGGDYYIFPIVQYFGGQPTVVWPANSKTGDIKIPDYAK